MFDPTGVRALVARLRAADPSRSIFGANGHHFEFRARIKERDLVAWERRHRVDLPSDYRAYLLELGNGGAGPYYGIHPLGMWDGDRRELEPIDEECLGDLCAPFPHRTAWNFPAARFEPPDFANDDEEDAWNTALDSEYFDPSLINGAIWISHHGCALRTMLVVTGAERGNVWADRRADHSGISPHVGGNRWHLTFGDWYMSWLEECLRESAAPVTRKVVALGRHRLGCRGIIALTCCDDHHGECRLNQAATGKRNIRTTQRVVAHLADAELQPADMKELILLSDRVVTND